MAAAVQSFIPEVWSARFTSKLRERLVWGSLVNRNFEGEIAAAGDTVKIPTSSTSITVADYTVDTDIADPTLTGGSTQDLVINKQKYYHFYVDDIDKAQSKPDIMDDAMDEAAFEMSKQVDGDLKDIFNGAYDSTRLIQAITDTQVSDTIAGKFLGAVRKLKRVMSNAYHPLDGRWLVIHPDTLEFLEKYFSSANGNSAGIYLPRTSESTLRNGFAGMLYGFRLHVTTECPEGTDQSTNKTWRLFAGRGNEAVTHASQLLSTEAYRPEKRFGDAVKGLNVYGSKAVLPARLYTIEHRKAV